MVEVVMEGIGQNVEEGTIQTWFFEEGDAVSEGEDLVEISTPEGVVTVQAPATGILAEVYYDEGELVAKGEVICIIDEENPEEDEEDEEEEDEEDEEEEKQED